MSDSGQSHPPAIDFERLYRFRFRNVDQAARQAVWNEIGRYLYERMGRPHRVLDPAGGRAEFLNAIPAPERWLVDMVDPGPYADDAIKVVIGDALTTPLPEQYFDGVFVSNLLEHLPTQVAVAGFLARMRESLNPGGTLAVMGPNFKYCSREYFDCADHTLALTHVAVEEHLYAAGFRVKQNVPRFLPYSFRGLLPPSPALTRRYLQMPLAWRLLGKQFLVFATPDAMT